MKIKHQLAIFNALTRLSIILLLWLALPVLVERVIFKHIDSGLTEKKQKFIQHLDKQEINDFLVRNDSTETYASFSTLHNEFVLLSRLPSTVLKPNTIFINEDRVIEDEQNEFRILQYNFTYDKTGYQLEIGSSLNEITDLIFIIRLFVLALLVSVVIMTFVIDTFFIEYLFTSFYKIVEKKIRRVNEPETFDYTRIQSSTADFRELDNVLNQMMERIDTLFKKEKQFISNVSHELLTPISLLKNRFENLLQNDSLNNEAVDKIVSSLQSLDKVKKIVNNLLLISRIDNHQFEANELIDIKQMVQAVEAEIADRIVQKQMYFSNNISFDKQLKGDSTLLHILFYNLLINAVKYSTTGGKIEIADGISDDQYFIAISDTGVGMNSKQLEKIFDRFTRFNLEEEGQGIGLAIAASIANFHGIKISVESELGKGTTFTLIFPMN